MQITEVSEHSLKTLSTKAFILKAQFQALLYLNLFYSKSFIDVDICLPVYSSFRKN